MNRADRRKTAKTNKERIDEYNEAGRQMMVPGGDMKQAQRLFRQVLSLDPGDAQANLHLGVHEMWTRNYKKAQELFARAYERDPRNPLVLNNLGLSLHEQGGVAEAMPLYEQALNVDPNNVEARINLARALLHVNQRDQALAHAKQAVAMRPEFGTAQYMLGTVAQTMGEVDIAKDALQKAVDLIPGHMEANFRLSRLVFDANDPEAFLKPARASWEANMDNIDSAITFTELLFGAGRFTEARDVIMKHADTQSALSMTGTYNAIAYAHANLGDYDTAIEWHKRAIATAPDEPSTRLGYGRTLLWSGDHKAANEQFRKSIQAMPFAQDLISMLMYTQKLAGQTEAVAQEMEHLVQVSSIEPTEAYATIEDLNKALLAKFSEIEQKPVHPFDKKRRCGDTAWEAALGMQDVEPIAALSELLQEKMTGYVADMPDGVRNHPLLVRKQFGLGSSGSHAETINNFESFSYAVDQQGWFRLIYFVNVPKACDDEDKKAGWLRLGVPHFETKDASAPDREIKPVAGQVVMIPAYQWYGFNALSADEDLTFISVQVNSSVG